MPTEKTLKYQDTLAPVDSMVAITDQDKAGKFEYRYPREGNEAHRWRCMKRNMRHDERLTRESGQRLLDNARKLPSGTQLDRDELAAEFHERFWQDEQQGAPAPRGRVRGD